MVIKQHRIFLAINLPDKIKKRLSEFRKEWFDFPVKLTRVENLHITLFFIGYVNTEEILDICKLAKKAISQENMFEIKLNKICFGPLNKKPRMIWAIGDINNNLSHLKNSLEDDLFGSNKNAENHNKLFHPHITLAKIKQKEWGELPSIPNIEKDISLSFLVDSVEVMESCLSRKGPEYNVLETILLK